MYINYERNFTRKSKKKNVSASFIWSALYWIYFIIASNKIHKTLITFTEMYCNIFIHYCNIIILFTTFQKKALETPKRSIGFFQALSPHLVNWLQRWENPECCFQWRKHLRSLTLHSHNNCKKRVRWSKIYSQNLILDYGVMEWK